MLKCSTVAPTVVMPSRKGVNILAVLPVSIAGLPLKARTLTMPDYPSSGDEEARAALYDALQRQLRGLPSGAVEVILGQDVSGLAHRDGVGEAFCQFCGQELDDFVDLADEEFVRKIVFGDDDVEVLHLLGVLRIGVGEFFYKYRPAGPDIF